jgi:hypothetical protein
MTLNWKELGSGLILILAGLLYGYTTIETLPLGNTLEMGPGGFPIVLCGLLIILGAIICLGSLFRSQDSEFGVVPWRAVVMLSLSVILFGTFLRQLGMFPTVFASAFLATMAEPKFRPLPAAIVAFCLAVSCTLLFVKGIGLPVPVIGSFFLN